MLMDKPVRKMLDAIAGALEGTKTPLAAYLLRHLCEDPWQFLCRLVTHNLDSMGLVQCSECETWGQDYDQDPPVCPNCIWPTNDFLEQLRAQIVLVDADFPVVTAHNHELPQHPSIRTPPPLLRQDPWQLFSDDMITDLPPEPPLTGPLQEALATIMEKAETWSESSGAFADWATARLFVALEAEIVKEKTKEDLP